MAKAVSD